MLGSQLDFSVGSQQLGFRCWVTVALCCWVTVVGFGVESRLRFGAGSQLGFGIGSQQWRVLMLGSCWALGLVSPRLGCSVGSQLEFSAGSHLGGFDVLPQLGFGAGLRSGFGVDPHLWLLVLGQSCVLWCWVTVGLCFVDRHGSVFAFLGATIYITLCIAWMQNSDNMNLISYWSSNIIQQYNLPPAYAS